MVTVAGSSNAVRDGRGPSLWLVLLAAIVILGLSGAAWIISGAIDRYHDRIALKGLDGKPSPVSIDIGTEHLVIPANLIRFPADRRGGLVTAVDLVLLWPSLDGFSEERAAAFRDGASEAPLIYVTIAEAETPLDSTARLDTLYSRYFVGPALEGPAALTGHAMDPESAWRGEIVYFETGKDEPFVVRCLAEESVHMPATCIREVNIGSGLTMLYRFNRAWLGDWRTMDDRIRRLTNQFFRRA